MASVTETPTSPADDSIAADDSGTLQIVGFRLGKEEYGIEITKVREIILTGEVTSLPNSSDHLEGVINLRNLVIPIVDMRSRLGLPRSKATDESRIMIVNVEDAMIGVVVDAVTEVSRISRDKISPPPPAVAGFRQNYLRGLVKLEGRLMILLDMGKVFSEEDATITATEPTEAA